MKSKNNLRTVEIKINGEWVYVGDMPFLQKGDIFRMYEPSGEMVENTHGDTEFQAESDPYFSDAYNTWMIDISGKY